MISFQTYDTSLLYQFLQRLFSFLLIPVLPHSGTFRIGLRNYLLGFRDRDSGHAIENIVYFELIRRGYDVSIGTVGNFEVDFIATKADNKLYVQVTESMTSEDVRSRELAPLKKISDNYEKIVLSLNTGIDSSYDGIKSINLIDWLISE